MCGGLGSPPSEGPLSGKSPEPVTVGERDGRAADGELDVSQNSDGGDACSNKSVPESGRTADICTGGAADPHPHRKSPPCHTDSLRPQGAGPRRPGRAQSERPGVRQRSRPWCSCHRGQRSGRRGKGLAGVSRIAEDKLRPTSQTVWSMQSLQSEGAEGVSLEQRNAC
ncbi:hypothetical protein AAFF_G00275160 [Aldrovandia affinis]|uniref:Uncharacterized protein n=1 Tax=Aldrovandia affinis TaxID=143900 RepID=A0AAD7SRT4_9TELE|nr:hypothetical protein AAFF_G00275160 [Aldrovandia affinis]